MYINFQSNIYQKSSTNKSIFIKYFYYNYLIVIILIYFHKPNYPNYLSPKHFK